MQKVLVIILHYGVIQNTLDCIESLRKIIVPVGVQIEIIVVDNASKQEFPTSLGFAELRGAGKIQALKVIRKEENLGFAEGNNVGIRYALEHGADYVLVLNNDTVVDEGLIKELLKVARGDSKTGIVAPKIYFAKGFEFHKDRYLKKDLGRVFWYAGGDMDWDNVMGHHRGVDEIDSNQYDQIEETSFASGCCMFVKKEVFEKIGLFDNKYFLYYEDADLSERVKQADYKIIYAPEAVIWHKNAGSAGGSGSILQDYYITRNRLLFGLRYAPIRSKMALVKESLSVLLRGRYWQKRGVLDFYLGRFGRGSFDI